MHGQTKIKIKIKYIKMYLSFLCLVNKCILACWWPVKAETRCSSKLHLNLVVSTVI